MAEKEREKPKPKKPAGPEHPRIGEKVQPMGLKGTKPDRDESGSLARKLVDEMGKLGTPITESQARKAVERGWASKEERDYLNGVVKRWGKALGIDIRTSFDDKRGGGAREGQINFTQVFAEDVRHAPDIIVGHEGGHCIEHQKTGWSVDEFRRNEDYLGRYIREGFEHERHSMPPFSLTQYHQTHQGKLFDKEYDVTNVDGTNGRRSLRQDVGYNARQIYCDSLPFKEVLVRDLKGEPPIISSDGKALTVDRLIGQYLSYMDRQYNEITGGKEELAGQLPANQIPVVARFGASAWAMEYLAAEIPEKSISDKRIDELRSWSDKFLKLFGHHQLRRGKVLDLRDTPAEKLDPEKHMLMEQYTGEKKLQTPESGLGPEEVLSIIILTRAYKRHFMACISRRELIQADDLRPHFERLRDGSESEKIREAHMLQELADVRAINPFVSAFDSGGERVKKAVADAMNEIFASNISDEQVFTIPTRILNSGSVSARNKTITAVRDCPPKMLAQSIRHLIDFTNDPDFKGTKMLSSSTQYYYHVDDKGTIVGGSSIFDRIVDSVENTLIAIGSGRTNESIALCDAMVDEGKNEGWNNLAVSKLIEGISRVQPDEAMRLIGRTGKTGFLISRNSVIGAYVGISKTHPKSLESLGGLLKDAGPSAIIPFAQAISEISKDHPDEAYELHRMLSAKVKETRPSYGSDAAHHMAERMHQDREAAEVEALAEIAVNGSMAAIRDVLSYSYGITDMGFEVIDNAVNESMEKVCECRPHESLQVLKEHEDDPRRSGDVQLLGIIGKQLPDEAFDLIDYVVENRPKNARICYFIDVAKALADIADKNPDRTISIAEKIVGDNHPDTLKYTAHALGVIAEIRPNETFRLLKSLIDKDEKNLCWTAVRAMGEMGEERADDALDVLEKKVETADYVYILGHIIYAVGMLGKKRPARCEKILKPLLVTKQKFVDDRTLYALGTFLSGEKMASIAQELLDDQSLKISDYDREKLVKYTKKE